MSSAKEVLAIALAVVISTAGVQCQIRSAADQGSGQDYLQRTETDSWYTGSSEFQTTVVCSSFRQCERQSGSCFLAVMIVKFESSKYVL